MRQRAGRAVASTLGGFALTGWLGVSAYRQIIAIEIGSPLLTPADIIAVGIVILGALVAAWHGLTFLAVLALHTLRHTRRAQRAGVTARRRPVEQWLSSRLLRWGFPLARRAILGAAVAGTGAGLAVLPAHATTEVSEDLGWGAAELEVNESANTPGTSAETPAEEAAEPAAEPAAESAHRVSDQAAPEVEPATSASDAVHEVRPGESLWSIAAEHLDPHATDAEIAAAWPQWYEANRAQIGADPHLIHPGIELDTPASHIPEEQA